MTRLRQHLHRLGGVITASALVVTGLAVTAAPAHADPVTTTDPVSGASITLSSAQISPGERVQISGRGFVASQGSTGDPIVAVRPYDFDAGPAWTIGGEDAYDPEAGGNPTAHSEAKYWFVTDHTDGGSFSGWIQAPTTLTATGPLQNGDHWLRILSGAFFTTTGDRLTDPITFKVPLTVTERVITGLTSPTGVFQAGTTFRPSAQLTVQGRGFIPDAGVAVSLDDTALPAAITADGNGSLPGSGRVTLPADLAVGQHTLRLATGAVVATVPLTITASASATVPTTRIRPGGLLAYDLTGYIGVGGQPQKIAVVVNEKVLRCIQADSTGSASGVVSMPADLTGSVVVGFNVGLSCILPPSGVINDQPVSRIAPTITISDSAPQLQAATSYAGGKIILTGTGFAPSAKITVTAGTAKAGTLTADTAGRFDGGVPAPAAVGTYRVIADDGTNTAATTVTLAAKRAATLTVAAPTPLSYGSARTTTIALKLAGKPGTGTVALAQGSWSKRVTIASTGTKVDLPRDAKVGNHTLVATIAATDTATAATTTRKFTVTRAAASATLKLSTTRIKKTKRATATVTVALTGAPQVAATGKITIYDGTKRIATHQLKASHQGTLKVKLPKIKKKGTHKIKAGYAGNAHATGKTSNTVRLKVVS